MKGVGNYKKQTKNRSKILLVETAYSKNEKAQP